MKKRQLSQQKFLKGVAQGKNYRIIDFRGDYWQTMPGAIPVQFDYDIFFEEEGWTQDMLGVPFTVDREVVLVCDMGGKSLEAMKLFHDKNPGSQFVLNSLNGGWHDYLETIKKMTENMRKRDQFRKELTDIATSPERFRYLVEGILKKTAPWYSLSRLFNGFLFISFYWNLLEIRNSL
ncbi:MAG: hypothetical protein HQL73_03295 [Magnetococcales bacterium]|nr:hypothetical protein [Magnetococcales bacterium]